MERKSEGWMERYLIAKYGTVTSGACKKGMKWIQEEKRWEKVYHKTMQSARLSQAVLSSLPRFWVDDQNWSVGSKRSDARFSSLVRRRAWKRVMRISNSMQKARNPSFLSYSFLHRLMAADRERDVEAKPRLASSPSSAFSSTERKRKRKSKSKRIGFSFLWFW